MLKRFLVLCSVCVAYGSAVSHAQTLVDGFMRGAGNATVALSYSSESYDEFWKGTTLVREPNLGTIKTQSVSLFASVGIFDYLDVVASLPYISTTASEGYWSSQNGMQDLAVSIKYRPLKHIVEDVGTVSAVLAAGIATPTSNYIPDAPVAIGHYSTMGDLRALLNFHSQMNFFGNVQFGYIRRGDVALDRGYSTNVPDAAEFITKIGYAHSDFYVDMWYHNQSARGGTDIGQRSMSERGLSFPSNGISFQRVGLNAFMPLTFLDKALGAGIGTAYTFDGRNIGQSLRLSASVVYNLKLWSND